MILRNVGTYLPFDKVKNSNFNNASLATPNVVTYLLTTLHFSRVVLEKLTGFQLVEIFPLFMEPEGSLPHSQVPATCPYPQPARSSPYSHNLLL